MRRPRLAVAALLVALAGAASCGRASADEPARRTAHVTIHFSHFYPSQVDVHPGDTVTFVVQNTDPIDHEFILGDAAFQEIHEKGTEAYHPPRPGEITVPAGTTQVTTYTFPARNPGLTFACHVPGHFAYGMVGLIKYV